MMREVHSMRADNRPFSRRSERQTALKRRRSTLIQCHPERNMNGASMLFSRVYG